MSKLAPRLAAATTGLLSGLTITQAVVGHWFVAALCAMGASLAGLWWQTSQRTVEAQRLAALFDRLTPAPTSRTVSEGCGSNHREDGDDV